MTFAQGCGYLIGMAIDIVLAWLIWTHAPFGHNWNVVLAIGYWMVSRIGSTVGRIESRIRELRA